MIFVLYLFSEAKQFFNALEALNVHFAQPDHNTQLNELLVMNIKPLSLSRLCEMRWLVAIKMVLQY